jgi:hypothetical protein
VVIWLIQIFFVDHGSYIKKWVFDISENWWWTFKTAMMPSRGLCSL